MAKEFLTLDKISAYRLAFDFSNEVWKEVLKWDYFAKETVGKQFVKAADSISANIAEGFGRYSKKDKVRFYRISMGSLEETEDWIRKSSVRELITNEVSLIYANTLQQLRKELYNLINFTNEKLKY
ncbi:four helix bundle protein [Maribellus sp. YY47]|uniref:four helix bundle protein n=1 Tax=Maribellus sp. YY47 TaxID=2929486 RepID=UPI0020017AE0|nr:four helix bundle protein [Maribellus sp. YY47]MCK3684600.1 four helix bundle protein [Maribellus sp. YY47]